MHILHYTNILGLTKLFFLDELFKRSSLKWEYLILFYINIIIPTFSPHTSHLDAVSYVLAELCSECGDWRGDMYWSGDKAHWNKGYYYHLKNMTLISNCNIFIFHPRRKNPSKNGLKHMASFRSGGEVAFRVCIHRSSNWRRVLLQSPASGAWVDTVKNEKFDVGETCPHATFVCEGLRVSQNCWFACF